MPIMWTDTNNPKFFLDFGCRTVGWQRKNQSLKEGVFCYGRGTFLLNFPRYPIYIGISIMTKNSVSSSKWRSTIRGLTSRLWPSIVNQYLSSVFTLICAGSVWFLCRSNSSNILAYSDISISSSNWNVRSTTGISMTGLMGFIPTNKWVNSVIVKRYTFSILDIFWGHIQNAFYWC